MPTEQEQHRLQMIMQIACEYFKWVHCIGSANRRGREGWRWWWGWWWWYSDQYRKASSLPSCNFAVKDRVWNCSTCESCPCTFSNAASHWCWCRTSASASLFFFRRRVFECDDVIRSAHVSRHREQQATASRGRRWVAAFPRQPTRVLGQVLGRNGRVLPISAYP